jgi:hypothetical protein
MTIETSKSLTWSSIALKNFGLVASGAAKSATIVFVYTLGAIFLSYVSTLANFDKVRDTSTILNPSAAS